MLRRLKYWLTGYLTVHIIGISPERFINLCSNRRIYIWNIFREDESYILNISAKNYKELKPIVRKTKLIPRIKNKHGLPFLIHRYRRGFR